jgi:hypothetical protein
MESFKEDSSEDEAPPPKKKSGVKFKVNVITTRLSKVQKPSSISIIRVPVFGDHEDPDIILDSGAQVTALSKSHPVMLDIDTKSRTELVFAGGAGGKVDSVARIGDLTNVHCSSSLTNECLSISQLSKLGYVVIFDNESAYVMKKNAEIVLDQREVLMTAKLTDGLYKMPLSTMIKSLVEDSTN